MGIGELIPEVLSEMLLRNGEGEPIAISKSEHLLYAQQLAASTGLLSDIERAMEARGGKVEVVGTYAAVARRATLTLVSVLADIAAREHGQASVNMYSVVRDGNATKMREEAGHAQRCTET